MPSIKLNKEVFEKLVGKTLPIDELKDRISMLGTDLEGIEGNIINVEIFPNRPDMLSEQGFARAFSSFIGVKTGLKDYKIEDSKQKIIIDKSVKDVRPYTACAIVKGLKFNDEKIKEVIQIQEKLHITFGRNRKKAAIGIYPMEKIKFPIKFVAKEPKEIKFQPLEYPEKLNALQILSKTSTGREYGHLLEGLDKFPVFIDADNKILSMPPIINSHDVGKIGYETKEVFIECSGFNLEHLQNCLNMIVTALSDMGGKIYNLTLEYDDQKIITPNLSPKEFNLSLDYVNKRLGLDLTEKELAELLSRMGHEYKKAKVKVPAYRSDIMHPVDFVEEVAIAYGYENFDAVIPEVATIGEEAAFEKFKRKVSEILIGLKLIETESYNLTNDKNQNEKMLTKYELIELLSAVNTEYGHLREWIIPNLMEVLQKNLNKEYPQNIFAIGTTFSKGNTETGIVEDDHLGVTICHELADFTSIKQIADFLMNMLDCQYEIQETEHPSFIPGRVGKIMMDGKECGFLGEVHPQVLDNWQIEMPIAAMELDLEKIYNMIK